MAVSLPAAGPQTGGRAGGVCFFHYNRFVPLLPEKTGQKRAEKRVRKKLKNVKKAVDISLFMPYNKQRR
ncbi:MULTISPECIES: hypothetical protein [Eubacteriales]|uniref:hypothetical protein n=1 Tax=Eubacteriales TaxID=186802 RepID=UPI00111F2421|nr:MULTISPECIES: hypothetical protein [Eubacteriales]